MDLQVTAMRVSSFVLEAATLVHLSGRLPKLGAKPYLGGLDSYQWRFKIDRRTNDSKKCMSRFAAH